MSARRAPQPVVSRTLAARPARPARQPRRTERTDRQRTKHPRGGAGRRRRTVRRRLFALAAVLLAVAALGVGGYLVLTRTSLFVVQNVEVAGTVTTSADQVRAAAGVEAGTPLAAVDTDAVARRVAVVPGIGDVTVSRRWPSTLHVQVSERFPVAVTSGMGERRLVDAAGNAYRPVPDPPPPLPALEVVHPAPDDPATIAALRVLAGLPPPLRAELVAVGATGPDAVTLRLARDRSVRWGSAEDADRKAAVLVPLLTRPGRIYDVVSPDLPTVRG